MNKETKFKVGDKAHKPKGYKFPCTIVGVFETIGGEVRVIGEMDEYGLLHIFNENQLEHYGKDEPDLLNEAYNNYGKKMVDIINVLISAEFKDKGWVKLNNQGKYDVLSQEEFINKCKTDLEFSQRWGLTIEERELSFEERLDLLKKLEIFQERVIDNAKSEMIHSLADSHSIPTKLITIKCNDKKIESYE
jgi:hypothetical protein